LLECVQAHVNSIITLANPMGAATCVCDLGKEGRLCEFDGTGCGTFTKKCVAAGDSFVSHSQR
jgi:hypothetical protein